MTTSAVHQIIAMQDRTPYIAPKLTDYGAIRDVTLGGVGSFECGKNSPNCNNGSWKGKS